MPPVPMTTTRLAAVHPGPVEDGADAGQDAAADERGGGQRDVRRDPHRLDGLDHRAFREGRVGRRTGTAARRRREKGCPGRPIALRHMVGRPRSQSAQAPQLASVDSATWSPGPTWVTPAPTASTTPAPSWPSTTGTGNGMVPSTTDRSLWHSPAAEIATSTSPGPRVPYLQIVDDLGLLPVEDHASHAATPPFRALTGGPDHRLEFAVRVQPERAAVAADAAVLEAAERRLGVALDGVDADVAAAQPGGQRPGAARVGAEDVVVEAVRGAVGDPHRLVLVVEGQGHDDRAEHLLAGDGHAGVRVGDEGRRDVEAGLDGRAFTAGDDAGALLTGPGEVRLDPVALGGGDQRADDRGVIHRVPHGQ